MRGNGQIQDCKAHGTGDTVWQPLVPAGPMVMLAEVASPHAVKGCLGNKVGLPSTTLGGAGEDR